MCGQRWWKEGLVSGGQGVRGVVLVALMEGKSSEGLVELLATENNFLVPFFCRTCNQMSDTGVVSTLQPTQQEVQPRLCSSLEKQGGEGDLSPCTDRRCFVPSLPTRQRAHKGEFKSSVKCVMCLKPLCSWRILCYSMLPMSPPPALHGTNIHFGVLRVPNVI